ncbi:MAG TPA: hypothetical protein VK811_01860, partial [Candidatus Acidoferrum sp.]|nr:hypothetical protein [Candidatus Acidoferrum sp.]
MFNLEQSIMEWRQQMLATGIKTSALDELESHLREEIEQQVRLGVHGQRAFDTAIQKIGPARELKTEFSKESRLRNILGMELMKEKPYSTKLIAFSLLVTSLFFSLMVIYRLGETQVMTFPEYMSAISGVLVADLLFCCGFFGRRIFPVIPGKPARMAIGAFLTMLIGLLVMILLTRINYDIGRFMAAFCWAFFVPMGALG